MCGCVWELGGGEVGVVPEIYYKIWIAFFSTILHFFKKTIAGVRYYIQGLYIRVNKMVGVEKCIRFWDGHG